MRAGISLTHAIAYGLWAVFWISWFGAGLWAAKTTSRPAAAREQVYRLLNVLGFAMVFWPSGTAFIRPLWINPPEAEWALLATVVAGFAFCWWARAHLGKLWSGAITRKEGHHIVDTGPYGLVRHPIYTGLILSGLAMALMGASWLNLAGVPVFIFGWWRKARLEEEFLADELGADAYAGYRARVPMLVPFLRGV